MSQGRDTCPCRALPFPPLAKFIFKICIPSIPGKHHDVSSGPCFSSFEPCADLRIPLAFGGACSSNRCQVVPQGDSDHSPKPSIAETPKINLDEILKPHRHLPQWKLVRRPDLLTRLHTPFSPRLHQSLQPPRPSFVSRTRQGCSRIEIASAHLDVAPHLAFHNRNASDEPAPSFSSVPSPLSPLFQPTAKP